MILKLFYKAMRILTWIIIIMAIIFVISKVLPFIGDVFNYITNAISGLFHKLDVFKDLIK